MRYEYKRSSARMDGRSTAESAILTWADWRNCCNALVAMGLAMTDDLYLFGRWMTQMESVSY